jgi:uncharacterized protein (DUF169 family)
MEVVDNFQQIAATLSESLNLSQPPVAVCFTVSAPAGVAHHEGRVAAGCVFWQEGARGAFVTSAGDHDLCSIGVHTHNLEPGPAHQSELGTALKIFAELGYLRPEDAGAVPVLKSRPEHVVYAPLTETPAVPDVVLLFVKAPAALVLSEACQQVEGGNPPAMGRPACAAIPHVVNTDAAAYSLGCCGARAYLDVLSDDVAVYAIPGNKLAAYTDRVKILSDANKLLTRFHEIRRNDVAAGKSPTINESLAAMQAQR